MAWAEVYFRTKRRLHPSSHLATIDMGQKLGGVVCPFSGVFGSTSNTMSRRTRPTSVPSGFLIHNSPCNSPCVASPVGKLPQGGPGLSGLVHEEAHSSISYHTQPSFKDIEARGPNRLLIQPIPPVDYPVRKKCFQQSRVHLIFAILSECPLVPLVFSSNINNSWSLIQK